MCIGQGWPWSVHSWYTHSFNSAGIERQADVCDLISSVFDFDYVTASSILSVAGGHLQEIVAKRAKAAASCGTDDVLSTSTTPYTSQFSLGGLLQSLRALFNAPMLNGGIL